MLNYETILSSFDDKVTLMQWLKKVESALQDASATAFDVTRLDNERVKFSLTFANGEKLETSVLIAIKGEKGEKGDTGTSVVRFYISGGHLYVELDNGITQDLGLLFSGDINVGGTITCTGVNAVDIFATGEIDGHKVTGDEIVEKMSGYSYINGTASNFIASSIYASVCKNGNKLTLVLAFDLEKTASGGSNVVGWFTLPSEVYNKIYPSNIGGQNFASVAQLACFKTSESYVLINGFVIKSTNNRLGFYINPSNLPLNEKHYTRYEVTFLLSDNLADE